MPRLIDLSHTITAGMTTDARLPVPRVHDVWTREQSAERYAPGVSFQIASIEFPQNTGTYLDAPYHRHDGMPGVWDFPIERTANLRAVVIDCRDVLDQPKPGIGPERFDGLDLEGVAVLFRTGWDAKWGSKEYSAGGHPYLTAEGALALAEHNATLFGIDALNADDPQDLRRPAHTILLRESIAIIENLTNLDQLPASGAIFHAAPVKAEGLGSFPVRAYAVTD